MAKVNEIRVVEGVARGANIYRNSVAEVIHKESPAGSHVLEDY